MKLASLVDASKSKRAYLVPTPESIEPVAESERESPSTSSHRRSQELKLNVAQRNQYEELQNYIGLEVESA